MGDGIELAVVIVHALVDAVQREVERQPTLVVAQLAVEADASAVGALEVGVGVGVVGVEDAE